MNSQPITSPDARELRRRAEARIKGIRGRKRDAGIGPRTVADTERLLHELQVHQIELEVQNSELQNARDALEAALEKYTDLYDFAPIGYFALDPKGCILEVNLAGAQLLGVDRSRLVRRRMDAFLAPESLSPFHAFLGRLFAGGGGQICKAIIRTSKGKPFWASLHGDPTVTLSNPGTSCRVAITDISAFKMAEEARRDAEVLTGVNEELRREIARRQAVEEALKLNKDQQTRLLQESRHMQAQMRHLSHEILQAQEEERKRISRELHDEVCQTLLGIHVDLESLSREDSINPRRFARRVARTQRLVEKSMEIVHRFARDLRPASLDDLGLIATVHAYMKEFTRRTGIQVQFATAVQADRLNAIQRTVFYRILQSALSNVAEHAQASSVRVSITLNRGTVCLAVQDNGKAFDAEAIMKSRRIKRLGLLGMRERTEMLGGKFSVRSIPGTGTTVEATIPVASKTMKHPHPKS